LVQSILKNEFLSSIPGRGGLWEIARPGPRCPGAVPVLIEPNACGACIHYGVYDFTGYRQRGRTKMRDVLETLGSCCLAMPSRIFILAHGWCWTDLVLLSVCKDAFASTVNAMRW